MSLQQAGNVKYIRWKMKFSCQPHLVKGLQENASKMEEELEKWNEDVKHARNEFYELNYYTTRQLLLLRSELGKLKSSSPVPYHEGQVNTLLHSISWKITPAVIKEAVKIETEKAIDREKPSLVPEDEAASVTVHPLASTSHQPPVSGSSTNLSEDLFASADDHTYRVGEEKTEKKFSVNDLNKKQLEHFKTLTEEYMCPEHFALKAIEKCHSGEWTEIVQWVGDNEADWSTFLQDEVDEDFTERDSEGEEEEICESNSVTSHDEEWMHGATTPGKYMHIHILTFLMCHLVELIIHLQMQLTPLCQSITSMWRLFTNQ